MDKEEWRDVNGFEGLYQVSDLGRIKSLERKCFRKCGRLHYSKKEFIKKTCVDSHGYVNVGLSIDGINKTYKVHQLVAVAFLNHKPNKHKLVIDHIDSDKTNNRLDNLQIVTQRFNTSKSNVSKTSKYTGVSFYKQTNRWVASIYIDGKTKRLGYFLDEHEAHLAYKDAIMKLEKKRTRQSRF